MVSGEPRAHELLLGNQKTGKHVWNQFLIAIFGSTGFPACAGAGLTSRLHFFQSMLMIGKALPDITALTPL
jgi:hypothetical protein